MASEPHLPASTATRGFHWATNTDIPSWNLLHVLWLHSWHSNNESGLQTSRNNVEKSCRPGEDHRLTMLSASFTVLSEDRLGLEPRFCRVWAILSYTLMRSAWCSGPRLSSPIGSVIAASLEFWNECAGDLSPFHHQEFETLHIAPSLSHPAWDSSLGRKQGKSSSSKNQKLNQCGVQSYTKTKNIFIKSKSHTCVCDEDLSFYLPLLFLTHIIVTAVCSLISY